MLGSFFFVSFIVFELWSILQLLKVLVLAKIWIGFIANYAVDSNLFRPGSSNQKHVGHSCGRGTGSRSRPPIFFPLNFVSVLKSSETYANKSYQTALFKGGVCISFTTTGQRLRARGWSPRGCSSVSVAPAGLQGELHLWRERPPRPCWPAFPFPTDRAVLLCVRGWSASRVCKCFITLDETFLLLCHSKCCFLLDSLNNVKTLNETCFFVLLLFCCTIVILLY